MCTYPHNKIEPGWGPHTTNYELTSQGQQTADSLVHYFANDENSKREQIFKCYLSFCFFFLLCKNISHKNVCWKENSYEFEKIQNNCGWLDSLSLNVLLFDGLYFVSLWVIIEFQSHSGRVIYLILTSDYFLNFLCALHFSRSSVCTSWQ